MERTLVLNASYEPLQVVSWKKAICLYFGGKVEILAEYERTVSSISFSMKLPSVIRLHRFNRDHRKFRNLRFNRSNIYLRDRYTCQYCGLTFPPDRLTFDHVIPVSLYGETSWENIVTCCTACNRRKGGHTPQQAGMSLIRRPRRPHGLNVIRAACFLHTTPEVWKDFLFL